VSWINSSNRQAVWKRALVRCGAVALPPGLKIVEEPTDLGEEQVADLRLLVERGLNLRKGVFQVPMLVGKGKRGPNLLEARSVFAFSQEPIGLQGGRKRKTARIETRSRRPGQKGDREKPGATPSFNRATSATGW